jgi:hypothetical protein
MRNRSALLLTLLALPAFAAGRVEERFSRSSITVGDVVEFTLTVTLPAGTKAEDLPGGLLLGAFEIKDYDLGQWETAGREQVLTQRFTLSTYSTGTFFAAPWQLKYKEGNGEVTLDVPPVPLAVVSVLAGSEEKPRDIKRPFEVPRKGLPWWAWAAIAAGALALGGLGIWWWRRRKGTKANPAEPPLPPDVRALCALEALERERCMEKGEAKRHYVVLGEILKDYAAGRWGVDTLDKTATELWAILKGLPLERGLQMKLKAFLDTGDLVKFAKHLPDPARGSEDLTLLRETVETTREEPHVPVP